MLIALFACACSDNPTIVDATSSGRQVSLDVGEALVIELPGNPSTGYNWYVDELDESVLELSDESFSTELSGVGAPGTSTFELIAVGSGTTQLRLVYERSFDNAEPLDTYELTVDVN